MKRSALQNEWVLVLRMAFRAPKVLGLSRNGPLVFISCPGFREAVLFGFMELQHFHFIDKTIRYLLSPLVDIVMFKF